MIISLFSTSLVAQTVKRPPTMRETWVRSLGQEDSLEKEMATHSSTLAWKIPWTEEPGVHGVAKSHTRLSDYTFLHTFSVFQLGENYGINNSSRSFQGQYQTVIYDWGIQLFLPSQSIVSNNLRNTCWGKQKSLDVTAPGDEADCTSVHSSPPKAAS